MLQTVVQHSHHGWQGHQHVSDIFVAPSLPIRVDPASHTGSYAHATDEGAGPLIVLQVQVQGKLFPLAVQGQLLGMSLIVQVQGRLLTGPNTGPITGLPSPAPGQPSAGL